MSDKCKKGGWGAWEKVDWKVGDWVWENVEKCKKWKNVKNEKVEKCEK
jgi:hypothetical protein